MRVLVSTILALALLGAANCHIRQEKIPPNRCLPGQSCYPSRVELAEFAATLTGDLYQPSDSEYSALVRNVNNRVTRNPALVVLAGDVGDVQKAMKFARKFQLAVTSSANNNDPSGRGAFDGSVNINLSKLTQISTLNVNTTRSEYGEVTAQAGAIWEDVYRAAEVFSRDIVAPNTLKGTVGGTVGDGGVGPLVRIYGLVADNLLEAEVVLADGSVVTASEYTVVQNFGNGLVRRNFDRALLAAIAGGGVGTYGIVTSYTFKMRPRPAGIVQARFSYKLWEGGDYVGTNVLEAVMGALPVLPEKWGGYVYIDGSTSTSLADTKGELIVDLFYYGTWKADADYDFIDNIVNLNAPDSLTSSSIVNRTSILDFEQRQPTSLLSPPTDRRYYNFATLLQSNPDVSDENVKLAEAMLFALNNPTIESVYYCAIQVMGGAAANAAYNMSLVNPALRSAYAGVACYLDFPGRGIDDSFYVAHAMDFRQLLEPYGEGKNHFWAEEDVLDWKKQFHGSTYGDLIETKLKYDIDNYLWCHNCVGSDFRLSCPHKDMKYGSLLSGYVSDSRYMMTKGREQASDHKARQPYIRQMSIP